MAVKKKTATKKKAPAKRRPARKSAKPAAVPAQHSVSVEPEAKVSGLGKFIVVLALLLLVLVLYMALRKPAATPAPAPAPAPAAAAPAAAPAPAAPESSAKPTAEAIPAAATAPKVSGSKAADEGTGLTLKSGASMTLRCWRKQDDQASLDVFGPHYKPVAHLASETGKAGWAHLTWKAQDDAGQNLAPGVYYLRPSTPGADKTVEVTLVP